MKQKPQIEKFREIARKLEADQSPERFDASLKKLTKQPARPNVKPEKKAGR